MTGKILPHDEIRVLRNRQPWAGVRPCCEDLIVAPLWISDVLNIGTLARSADAVNCCLAIPNHYYGIRSYLRGNTLGAKDLCPKSQRRKVHIHLVGEDPFYPSTAPIEWLKMMKSHGYHLLGAEIADGATALKDLVFTTKTVLVLGEEKTGIPHQAAELLDEIVEIPMQGAGISLNVVVAASLILYKLRNLI